MIYLIGGAPRAGKSILGQRVAAQLQIGWISTDLILPLLRMTQVEGVKTEWNAAPEAIATNAEWFFPYLERLVWGATCLADNYLIEGVDFLPAQVKQLSAQYPIQALFLGCAQMTLEHFDQFPGRSHGYSGLPEAVRRRFAQDVSAWSAFIARECNHFGYAYIDTANDFSQKLAQAESILTTKHQ